MAPFMQHKLYLEVYVIVITFITCTFSQPATSTIWIFPKIDDSFKTGVSAARQKRLISSKKSFKKVLATLAIRLMQGGAKWIQQTVIANFSRIFSFRENSIEWCDYL